MKVFIDDSGAFSWHNPGRSIFCGVTIPNRNEAKVLDAFVKWRKSVIGHSTRELKGSELTDNQLDSFVNKVISVREHEIWLTVIAADTNLTLQSNVEKLRGQAEVIFQRSAELMAEHGNVRVQETYRQMSGWIKNRSPQNLLWIVTLEEAVIQSIQHTIVRFMEPEDDEEFENLRIMVDESFIRRDEHVIFWREWLRNGLIKSSRVGHALPNTWRARIHPFIEHYSIHPGLLDLRRLFVRNTGFFRSHNVQGLQIADICANLLYRHHRGDLAARIFQKFRRRIVGKDGREVTIVEINESSLHKDDPRNDVGILDIEELKRMADARRAKRAGSHHMK